MLHEGSAVAILCKFSDYWDEFHEPPEGEFALDVKRILFEGWSDHFPLTEQAIKLAFGNEFFVADNLEKGK